VNSEEPKGRCQVRINTPANCKTEKPISDFIAARNPYTCGWHYWPAFQFTVQGKKAIAKPQEQVLVQIEMNDA